MSSPPAPQPAAPTWEGVIGLIASYCPVYQDADKSRFKVNPALFPRHGHLTITNASGFVTRRAEVVARGGGYLGDVSVGWEQRLSPASVLAMGASLALAGDRHMQTCHGINEAQAARTGDPFYAPAGGLRDVSVTTNPRTDFGPEWTLLAGAGAARLLGPAAASPLTRQRDGWGVDAGLAWRF